MKRALDSIGIDFGASYTDAVELKHGLPWKFSSMPSNSSSIKILAEMFGPSASSRRTEKRFAITGGVKLRKEFLKLVRTSGIKFIQVDELQAVAAGAAFLSGKKRFIAANVGTGTPIIFVNGKKFEHLGGTGVGGGTLAGLANLLLDEKVENLEALAKYGKSSLDLTVFDIVGSGIGIIPANATASNFARARRTRSPAREDLALSLLKLVGETIGVISALAAAKMKCGEIVFTGRPIALNSILRKKVSETVGLFGKKAFFPPKAEYCTAIGAALA